MNVGDIKRIKVNQDYTCGEARGKMCVIETMELDMRIRIQRDDNTHFYQHVLENHLEDV